MAWPFLLGVEEGTVPLGRAARKRLSVRRSLAACEVGAEDANNRVKMSGQVMSLKQAMERKRRDFDSVMRWGFVLVEHYLYSWRREGSSLRRRAIQAKGQYQMGLTI
ncbi:hypothetical protein SDJN03_21373, partial [Cucurbita argyrosperma subsp. sororia]